VAWTIFGPGTLTSGQVGYDGNNNAWLLDKSAASTYIVQSTTLSSINTFSVYAKAGTNTHLAFWIRNANKGKFFDLVNGTIGSDYINTPIDAKIESVGNGWYRCSVTTDDATNNCRIYPADGDGDVSGTSGSIYIQDAQLEQGLVATEYIETTTAAVQKGILENLPRIDYSSDVSCPLLLLEPQRTNTIADSEYFGSWTKLGAQNVVLNEAVSLDGSLNAALLTRTSANGSLEKSAALTIGSANTFSIFAKAESTSLIGIVLTSGIPITNCVFDLSTQTVSVQLGTPDAYGIEDYGNGWYRCYITDVATGASATCRISSGGYGTGGVYIYGAQMEAGAYPTSYIPTYGSSVTRGEDDMSVSSLQSNNIVEATDSYTIFFDISNDDGGSTAQAGNSQWLKGANSTLGNIWTLRKNDSTNQKEHSLYFNQGTEFVFTNEDIDKACFVFTSNQIKIFINGSVITTYNASVSPLDLNGLIVTYGSANRTSIVFSQLLLFPTALTDDECIALTTI